MTDEERINSVEEAISQGKQYVLLEQLEKYGEMQDFVSFRNYLLLLLVLIEKSKVYETAATLMLKKIYQEKTGIGNLSEDAYGNKVIVCLQDLALSPYVNLSATIGRLINTIIYDKYKSETAHIVLVTPRQNLLHLNEYFLEKYINKNQLDDNMMSIFYFCIANINEETFRIKLSDKACTLVLSKISLDGFDNYLSIFLRPYYSSMSSFWLPDARYHVPEPFFEQIFGTVDNFMTILKKRVDLNKRSVAREVYEFMIKFVHARANHLEFVDIGPLNLTRTWHKHVRFLD